MRKRTSAFTVLAAALIYLAWAHGIPLFEKGQADQVSLVFPADGEQAGGLDGSGKAGFVPGGFIKAKVTGIVDGDTIGVLYDKEEYKVRLLCIDTPESVMSGVEPQPYGKEASETTEKLAKGKTVKLVFDKGLYDRYGRLLAFVILDDGRCLNALLVYEGLARVEVVSPNRTYKEWFCDLQDAAIGRKAGMWALPEEKRPFVRDGDGEYVPRYRERKAS